MEDKTFELNTSGITFPEQYKTAGLFIRIDDCDEVCVITHHAENEIESKPFTLEFQAIKIPEDFKGEYSHWQVVLPNGKSVKMVYKVID